MNRPTVLITGSGGELGHGLIQYLSAEGKYDIVGLDLNEPANQDGMGRVEFHKGDIMDRSLLDYLFDRFNFDYVFHLAALLSTSSEKNPARAQDINVNGTFNLLERARKYTEKRTSPVVFMFPSTIAVYGLGSVAEKTRAGKVKEDQYLSPICMYGVNKHYVEELGRYFSTTYGMLESEQRRLKLDFRAVRYPGLLSADTIPTGGTSDYGPEMLHAAARGIPYSCFVKAESRLPFMAMPDAVDALIQLSRAPAKSLSRRVYNVGAFSVTAEEIYREILNYYPDAQVDYRIDPKRLEIVESWPADIDDSLARRDWGWAAKYEFRNAFRDYLVPGVRKHYGTRKTEPCYAVGQA
ncbi:MAG: NAD-dependent epimerase/dehydratase family protein [Oligoflexia bacterium]|nr:NAD-dependent epimerase/dehydratase family protein [Oligoflexia bacterium]